MPRITAAGRRTGPGPFDNGFLAYGKAHPATPMAIGVAALCTGEPPTREELHLLIGLATDICPELAAPAPAGPGHAGAFRPDRHLFEVRAPAGSGSAGLNEALNEVANEPLPGVMWGVWLIHGHAPGEFAVVLRGHHAHFDGMLIARLCGQLGGADPAGAPRPTPPAARRGAPDPRAAAREALGALRRLRYTTRPVAAAHALAGRVRQVCSTADLHHMRRIAATHEATVNDVYLTALAGALAAWETDPAWHHDHRPVRAKIPLGLRRPGTAGALGAEISADWLTLPCGTADPVERLALVAAGTRRIRARLADPGTGALMRTLPPRLRRLVLESDMNPRRTSLVATHVPGPARRLSLAGREITGILPLMFLFAGQRLSVCLATYADTAYFSVMADRSTPDLDNLPLLWQKELDRLAEAARCP
ncbi:hypothetical protein VR41_09255 [Streptomyces sp. NRRL B-1568]|nr:hypothetical protein VR41_09255 [Streptomyces sp. NRRL B-1568]